MADTIDELRSRVQLLIDRDDYLVDRVIGSGQTNVIDQAIRDSVKWFYRNDASRIPSFERAVTGTLSAGSNTIGVPSDFREFQRDGAFEVQRETHRNVLYRSTLDEILAINTNARAYLPTSYGRSGGVFYVERCGGDVTYILRYYRSLEDIFDITTTHYAVTPENYTAGHLSFAATGGTNLFFPTGTTQAQVQADVVLASPTLEPTAVATADNTVQFGLTGNARVNWLLNEFDDGLAYRAAYELGYFFDVNTEYLELWKQRADEQANELVQETIRLEASGGTPQQSRPSLFRANRGRGARFSV